MFASRRLAAMLAPDVAGYSRLMGADEEGTLERLKALRRELLDPKIAEHGPPPRVAPGNQDPRRWDAGGVWQYITGFRPAALHERMDDAGYGW